MFFQTKYLHSTFAGLCLRSLLDGCDPISVPDPKLIISDPDPDPLIENLEFRIRILL